MKWKARTTEQVGELICGDNTEGYFQYLTGPNLTRFFRDADTEFVHDGSTRRFWVADVLQKILEFPSSNPLMPPDAMLRVIRLLMDTEDAFNEKPPRLNALKALNAAIKREGFEAFYGEDDQCYLRHCTSRTVGNESASPHRPLSAAEIEKKNHLAAYLDQCSEDDLIEHVLLPLFRQLGFARITSAGHKDKALEYGKDIWMKFTLPTQHVIYFGIQVKKGKLDSSGITKGGQANVAEIHNQVLMMLGHEIFDLRAKQTRFGRSRLHRRRWRNYQGCTQLDRWQARPVQTKSDPLHGQGGHREPFRGVTFDCATGAEKSNRTIRRPHTVLAMDGYFD